MSALLQPLNWKGILTDKKQGNHPGKRNYLQLVPHQLSERVTRDGSENANSAFIVEQHGDPIYEVEEKTLAYHAVPQLLLATTALS